MSNIDFVISWVNNKDKVWQKKREEFLSKDNVDNTITRYRDWEVLKYWFRSIEVNASWVNNIYLIVSNVEQLPNWLNIDNPKLKVVFHKDYIDEKYLPTFNSCVIEAYLYKIKGLSENFVYFNDDMFINNIVNKKDFFYNDLPKDDFILTPIHPSYEVSSCITYNCMKVINKYFDFVKYRKNFKKLFNLKYRKYIIKNLTLSIFPFNVGIRFHHLPTSFKKSTFSTVWDLESDLLTKMSKNKFRSSEDVSQWLFQFWQIASGKFIVRDINFGKYFDIATDFDKIKSSIINGKYKVICLNDSSEIDDFDKRKKELVEIFEQRYPKKSTFER